MNSTYAPSRNTILDSIRSNQPSRQPMPAIPHFHTNQSANLVAKFSESIARMAGVVVADNVLDLNSFIESKFPNARIICSAIPDYAGTIKPANLNHWSEASTIDVCILRSPMGVAETGSILLSDIELHVNTIAFLAHDLVVLLDPKQIVGNIHDAYEHPYFKLRPYSVLMTGPSGSGDSGSGREDPPSHPVSGSQCRQARGVNASSSMYRL